MTETDWRALCKELVEEVDGLYEALQDMGYGWISPGSEALISRARTALAGPEGSTAHTPPLPEEKTQKPLTKPEFPPPQTIQEGFL